MTQETHHGVTIPTTQPQAITVESDPETLAGARDGVQRNDQELPERKDEHIPPSPDAAERDSEATSLDNVIKNAKSLNRELKSEKDLRIKAESEVQHLNAKLKSVQVKWKRAAQALDKILSQTQGPIPATDEELETKAKQLRYKIRGFAIEYFDQSPARHPAELGTQYERYLPKYGQAWADSSKVIQAFFWKVFENHVFKSYLWAGRFSSSLDELCCNLTEPTTEKLQTAESIQKRQAWRATTTALVLDHLTEADLLDRSSKDIITRRITQVLQNYFYDKASYSEGLESILDTAISLDKMITSQPTDIHWSFEKVIDAENGEEDIVVICPALIKRGKSNGEDFDVEAMILPNEVMRADFKR